MNKLSTYKTAARLPQSIDTPNIRELAKVLDVKLQELALYSEVLLIYPRIEFLSTELIDELAVQLHVDFYDTALPLDKRRQLVKNSLRWHMKKGTPAVVEELVQTIYAKAIVQEWWMYGAEPYHFRIVLSSGESIDNEAIQYLTGAINQVKNVRSWLDTITFAKQFSGKIYFGGAVWIHRNITVQSDISQPWRWQKGIHMNKTIYIHKEVTVHGTMG